MRKQETGKWKCILPDCVGEYENKNGIAKHTYQKHSAHLSRDPKKQVCQYCAEAKANAIDLAERLQITTRTKLTPRQTQTPDTLIKKLKNDERNKPRRKKIQERHRNGNTKKEKSSETIKQRLRKQNEDLDPEEPEEEYMAKKITLRETYVIYNEDGTTYRRYKKYINPSGAKNPQNMHIKRKFQKIYQQGTIPIHAQRRIKTRNAQEHRNQETTTEHARQKKEKYAATTKKTSRRKNRKIQQETMLSRQHKKNKTKTHHKNKPAGDNISRSGRGDIRAVGTTNNAI